MDVFQNGGAGGNGGYGGGGGGAGPPNGGPGSGAGGGGNGGSANRMNGQSGEGRGGAILLRYGRLAITQESSFINNTARGVSLDGTKAKSYGGAIFIDPMFSYNRLNLDSSVKFSSNFASSMMFPSTLYYFYSSNNLSLCPSQ